MDYSNASSDVQDINTLLQNLLNKFYPSFNPVLYNNGVFNNGLSLKAIAMGDGSYSLKVNNIQINCNGGSNVLLYLGKINFNLFGKISMKFNLSETKQFRVFISKTTNQYDAIYSYGWGTSQTFESGLQTKQLNCPDLTDEYYIILDLWGSNSYVNIYNITMLE